MSLCVQRVRSRRQSGRVAKRSNAITAARDAHHPSQMDASRPACDFAETRPRGLRLRDYQRETPRRKCRYCAFASGMKSRGETSFQPPFLFLPADVPFSFFSLFFFYRDRDASGSTLRALKSVINPVRDTHATSHTTLPLPALKARNILSAHAARS